MTHFHRRNSLVRTTALLALTALTASSAYSVQNNDVFHFMRMDELKFEGDGVAAQPPRGPFRSDRFSFDRSMAMFPYGVLDGDGEIYIDSSLQGNTWIRGREPLGGFQVGIRAPARTRIKGWVFVPNAEFSGMVKLPFTVEGMATDSGDRAAFLRMKHDHYERLLNQDAPGAAWFRHQVSLTKKALHGTDQPPAATQNRRLNNRRRNSRMEDTYAIITGGRAVSENLQLDRLIPTTEDQKSVVDIDSIQGITIREFEWGPLVHGLSPQLDPLASLIPDDQHAVFFESFADLIELADLASEQGTPVLRAAEPRAEDARTRRRYETQLCLPTSTLARLLGPQLVRSVALTGSDPYLRTGSDVAILFEATNLTTLKTLIMARVAMAGQSQPDVEQVRGQVGGITYSGMRSPDRSICSYVAAHGNAVMVTNSLVQIRRLAEVSNGDADPLASLPEYTFFRDRYPRGKKTGSALLVISDKTIRRWCGPRWRISTSRRTRAAGLLAELQARHMNDLVRENAHLGRLRLPEDLKMADAGELLLDSSSVRSSVYGSLAFQTPISEMDLAQVSKAEADFYNRWRRGYERNWQNFFDPIAARISMKPTSMALDLTVMPLITGTEYREVIDITRGAKITPGAGDPHKGTLLHWVMALNRDSPTIKRYGNLAMGMAPQIQVDPLGWLGETVAFYADEDPFWEEAARAENPQSFLTRNFARLPIAVELAVDNGLKLTAFLAGLRAFIEQTSPGMTIWETQQHHDLPYVRIRPSENARSRGGDLDELAIFYAASGDALIITLHEELLKRALDRQAARRAAGPIDGKASAEPSIRPWLGQSMSIQADQRTLQVLQAFYGNQYHFLMQVRAWRSLAILNEWKRIYPDQDPVQLHETFWQMRLVCPGGGKYQWNDQWKTMESTIYGHPGKPKAGQSFPPALSRFQLADFGLTFEENGLRAKVKLEQKAVGN